MALFCACTVLLFAASSHVVSQPLYEVPSTSAAEAFHEEGKSPQHHYEAFSMLWLHRHS